MYAHQTQSPWSLNIPPLSHYTVYHNVTCDGDQGIIVYDTSVTIYVTNGQFNTTPIYFIQVAAVNVIGQGPVNETTLSEFLVINKEQTFN